MKTLIYILLFCCAHCLLQAQPSQAWEQLLDEYADYYNNHNLAFDEQNQQLIWSFPSAFTDISGTLTDPKGINAAFAATTGQANWIEWCDTLISTYSPMQALSATQWQYTSIRVVFGRYHRKRPIFVCLSARRHPTLD